MTDVPSYVRNHLDDLERSLARVREKEEELRALPRSEERDDALRTNAMVAESIERTLHAARVEQPAL